MKKREKKKIALASLGSALKKSSNGWTNYHCPRCRDNKPDHFWVSADEEIGWCHKCHTFVQIEGGRNSKSAKYGDTEALQMAVRGVLNEVAKEEEDSSETMKKYKNKALSYYPLDLVKLGQEFQAFNVWEVQGHCRQELHNYCRNHNIHPIDVANVHGMVLLPKSADYKQYPVQFTLRENPYMELFFPIFRGGVAVAAWMRSFNHIIGGQPAPRWRSVGLTENGQILYTSALPGAAVHAKSPCPHPIILVEGPSDALRLARFGLWAVAIGGTNMTAKARVELLKLPSENILILLDQDAEDKAVDLWSKISSLKKTVVIGRIDRKGKDPSDLTDSEIRTCISTGMQLIAEAARQKEGGNIEEAQLAELALTGSDAPAVEKGILEDSKEAEPGAEYGEEVVCTP